jgi:uncharacterized protein GlcG (DUF336 family)
LLEFTMKTATSFLPSIRLLALTLLFAVTVSGAQAQTSSTFSVKLMTPETALTAARAALDDCRRQGYQISVAVVDRFGIVQVLLRDRFAGAHTVSVASDKAWTAASFRIATGALGEETQPGKPMSALRAHPRVLAAGGGLVIETAGSVLGAIGVSGAPGGDADDSCARAGVRAITDALELQG